MALARSVMSRPMFWVGAGVVALVVWNAQQKKAPVPGSTKSVQTGVQALHGGTPTVRRSFVVPEDDPSTTNDESNDQPRGHFGTVTVSATSVNSGNTYPLDADVDGTALSRIYFPKGGWVDFSDCELGEGLSGECDDEQGRSWVLNGPG
jgi:hypothetical protein